MEFEFTRASPYPPGAGDCCCDSECMSCEEDGECCCKEGGCCKKEEGCCCKEGGCCKEGKCCKEEEGCCCSDGECECCSEDDVEEEILKLDFDMDVMDQFTKDCEVSISPEDFLAYLVNMEFISFFNFDGSSLTTVGRRMGDWRQTRRIHRGNAQPQCQYDHRQFLSVPLFVASSFGNTTTHDTTMLLDH